MLGRQRARRSRDVIMPQRAPSVNPVSRSGSYSATVRVAAYSRFPTPTQSFCSLSFRHGTLSNPFFREVACRPFHSGSFIFSIIRVARRQQPPQRPLQRRGAISRLMASVRSPTWLRHRAPSMRLHRSPVQDLHDRAPKHAGARVQARSATTRETSPRTPTPRDRRCRRASPVSDHRPTETTPVPRRLSSLMAHQTQMIRNRRTTVLLHKTRRHQAPGCW